jgi:transposase
MSRKTETPKPPAEKIMEILRRRTRKPHSAEEKIRIVLEGRLPVKRTLEKPGIPRSTFHRWHARCRAFGEAPGLILREPIGMIRRPGVAGMMARAVASSRAWM